MKEKPWKERWERTRDNLETDGMSKWNPNRRTKQRKKGKNMISVRRKRVGNVS
jgi:hypothetical protein